MSHTLPGDIPGLLRRGSPVVLASVEFWNGTSWMDPINQGRPGVVVHMTPLWVSWCGLDGGPECLVDVGAQALALDLSDPAGRVHAAWWCEAAANGLDGADCGLVMGAEDDFDGERIERLRQLVLRLHRERQ